MQFEKTKLSGALIITPEMVEDERGFFARTFCRHEFSRLGLVEEFVQCSISYNHKKGTLRGLHYQLSPHQETKLVRCTRGAIYDVVVDLRQESATYCQWIAVELTAENRKLLYVPEGFAHGFLTLTDDAEVFYQISKFYVPNSAAGLRYDDPTLAIDWPSAPVVISPKDLALPKLSQIL